MGFEECMKTEKHLMMEGALGERLKREYGLKFDPYLDMAALVYTEAGRSALETLWKGYMEIAQRYDLPFLATTPTRRTNWERIRQTGYDDSIIKANVDFLRSIRYRSRQKMYVGGLVGCRGDAYTGKGCLSRQEAYEFHQWETRQFAEAGVDFLYAALMPTLEEAAGMALAIQETGVPCILSFTIQKNGCLVDGTPIVQAIEYIDHLTDSWPVCYMTNCVHPAILFEALSQAFNRCETVRKRFLGIQANTANRSYAELDGSAELKTSQPEELAAYIAGLGEVMDLRIAGGCCGTDDRHMEEIAKILK